MKTLYIIRHAKSSWDFSELADFDRPLAEKGKKDAKRTGLWLVEHKVYPDLVLSSPAKRAKSTIKRICKQIDYPFEDVQYEQKIYDYHMEDVDWYVSYLMEVENKHDEVFITGHNMAWDKLGAYFIGRDIGHLLPSGIFIIQFDIDSWNDISYENGQLQLSLNPKDLK